jgi:hypothetical protein
MKHCFFIEVPGGKCQGRVGLIAINQSRLPGGISGKRLFFVFGDCTANGLEFFRCGAAVKTLNRYASLSPPINDGPILFISVDPPKVADLGI